MLICNAVYRRFSYASVQTNDDDNDGTRLAISKQSTTLVSADRQERGENIETNITVINERDERVSSRESGPDETNSKRDVLLIILTLGVRLNERRSQTREAPCKFNYREEEGAMKSRARENDGGQRQKGETGRTTELQTARVQERKGNNGRGREIQVFI